MKITTSALLLIVTTACSYREPIGSTGLSFDDAGVEPDAAPHPGNMPANVVFEGDVMSWLTRLGDEAYVVVGPGHDMPGYALMRIGPDRQAVVVGALDEFVATGYGLAQDEARVYVSVELEARTDQAPANLGVVAFDKQMHTSSIVTSGWTDNIYRMVVAGDDLYVVTNAGSLPMPHSRLVRVPTNGGPGAETLVSDLGSPGWVRSDGTYVYVADYGSGRIVAAAVAPPHQVLQLATGLLHPYDVMPYGDWLYVTEVANAHDGEISRVHRPAADATQETIDPQVETIVSGLTEPSELTTDGSYLYWTSYFHGLERAPLAGGPVEVVATWGGEGYGPLVSMDDFLLFSSRRCHPTGPERPCLASFDVAP